MTQEKNDSTERSSIEASLARSREEIRALTMSILDLANARQKIALQVSRDKVLLGQGISNPDVEKKLLNEAKEHARSISLDEELAQAIVLDLIRFSKIVQSADTYRKQIREFLESNNVKTVSVVGAGRMGVWFAKYFRDLSLSPFFYDEKPEKAREKAADIGVNYLASLEKASESDLVIVSIPISRTPRIVREIAQSSRKGSERILRLIEISSVKSEMGASGLFSQEAPNENVELYSIHPLFGGSAHPFELNSILQSFPTDVSFIRGLFPHFTIVSLEWEAHDRLMGLLLTLPHGLALVFADALCSGGIPWQEVMNLNGPSFLQMLDLSRKVLSEDPEVYYEIQASNPNSKGVLSNMMNSLLKLEKVLRNRSEFVEFFQDTRSKIEEASRLRVQ